MLAIIVIGKGMFFIKAKIGKRGEYNLVLEKDFAYNFDQSTAL